MSFKRIRIHSSVSCLALILALTCSGLVIAGENRPLPATQPAAAAGQQVAPAAATTQPAGQPALSVDAAEHDFGQVRSGEKVEHRFQITNTGSAELEITNVKPNCGCTVAGFSSPWTNLATEGMAFRTESAARASCCSAWAGSGSMSVGCWQSHPQ